MSDARIIAYRRLVSNIARELCAEDVEQIAFVRLAGKDNITKYSAAKPTASALDLMVTLERFDIFSRDKISGLVEVALDARRNDIARKIKDYEEKQLQLSRRSAKPPVKKRKQRTIRSEEHQQLGEVHDMILTKCVDLEEHAGQFRETLKEDIVMFDDASQLLQKGQLIAEELASNLRDAKEKLSSLSISRTSSCSSGSSGTGEFTSVSEADTLSTPSTSTKGVSRPSRKPVIKKRPLHLPVEKPIQETVTPDKIVEQHQQLVVLPQSKVKQISNGSSKFSAKKPPPPPKKPPKNAVRQPLEDAEAEKDDRHRDSGLFTGSGYEDVEEWRKHIKNLPPDHPQGSEYQFLVEKDKDGENEYATPLKPGKSKRS